MQCIDDEWDAMDTCIESFIYRAYNTPLMTGKCVDRMKECINDGRATMDNHNMIRYLASNFIVGCWDMVDSNNHKRDLSTRLKVILNSSLRRSTLRRSLAQFENVQEGIHWTKIKGRPHSWLELDCSHISVIAFEKYRVSRSNHGHGSSNRVVRTA